jgi:hypothetical protein
MSGTFDSAATLEMIHRQRETARRRAYYRSKLSRYRAELVQLRLAGGSYPDLVVWLRKTHHVKVSHTTVMRYLKQLPELADYSPPSAKEV